MRRGEIWTAADGGDYAGKPRPVLILQTDLYAGTASVTICGFTSDPTPTEFIRPAIVPSAANGLREPCRVMADKLTTISRSRLGQRIGVLTGADLREVERALMVFLVFA